MDLSLTEEQELLKRTAHDFLSTECPDAVMRALDNTDTQFSRDVWDKMAGLGWMGLIVPAEYGGLGGSLTDLGVLYEEMGRAVQPTTHHSTAVIAALLLTHAGSEVQRMEHLPNIAEGRSIFALAATELSYGWAAEDVTLTATAQGGEYVLDGSKHFVHDAHLAGHLIVVARTGPGATPADGITLFLVDAKASGIAMRRVTGNYGDRQNEVHFDHVRVPAADVLGEVGKGWGALQQALEPATAVLCSYMAGGLEAVVDMTVEYAKTRHQFGVAIGTFQRVQDHVIDIVNAMDGAKWTAYEALWKLDNQKPGAGTAVSVAKALASDGFDQGTFHSHEVHAGMGISREYPLYLYTKKARTLYAYLGDPRHHRERVADLLEL